MSDQDQRVAMVIVAHPDDAEFGCAGTMAAWAREGWDVYLVICTDAAAGGPDEATDVTTAARQLITAARKAEQRAAATALSPDASNLPVARPLLAPSDGHWPLSSRPSGGRTGRAGGDLPGIAEP